MSEITTTLPLPIERKLYFTERVTQDSICKLSKSIIDINKNDKHLKKLYKLHGLKYKRRPIEILIDSYGGDCYAIMGLVGVMEQSKTPIHTIAVGAAMSCGFIMLICGHKRFAYKHATPMYHSVSSGVWGKIKEMEEDVVETKRLQIWFEELTLKKTKLDPVKLKDNYEKKQDWYMTAIESKEFGVIDEII